MARYIVGLSGGVDSSAVCSLLLEEGHEVCACVLTMQHDPCCVPGREALERARALSQALGITLVERDVSELFARSVVSQFVDEYACGRTPNPCIVCNASVKFAALDRVATELGCDWIATGHYVGCTRISRHRSLAVRGDDPIKDQSYFLYRVDPCILSRCRFPLASVSKEDTRAYASQRSLAAAEAKDSTGVCFAPNGDYHENIRLLRPELLEPGPIVSEEGELLGEHAGIACYTVGQRKGLGLSGGPWFITRIDPKTRVITVSHGSQPHARSFSLSDVVLWDEPGRGGACLVQTHYRAKARPAHVTVTRSTTVVELDDGSTLAADGQSCVLYRNNTVIGGGYIRLQA